MKKKREELKKRLADRVFLAAVAAGIYQALEANGVAPDAGTYQLWVDIACYAIIGGGIYKTFN